MSELSFAVSFDDCVNISEFSGNVHLDETSNIETDEIQAAISHHYPISTLDTLLRVM